MSTIGWITPSGLISKVTENEYFEFKLDAYDSAGLTLRYKVIAGSIGNGLQLFNDGLIQGIPIVEYASASLDYEKTFTVRATNTKGKISDRTFKIVTTSIALPVIIPRNTSLGTFYDGYHYKHQLVAVDPSPGATLVWTLNSGELPPGVSLSTSGLLSGYIYPNRDIVGESELGWDNAFWDRISWDVETAVAQSKNYQFTVRVYDGTRYDESQYSINVIAKSSFTVDNTTINSDTDAITTDIDTKLSPFIKTVPTDLLPIRQNSKFAFKIEGVDFNNEDIRYALYTSDAAVFDQGAMISTRRPESHWADPNVPEYYYAPNLSINQASPPAPNYYSYKEKLFADEFGPADELFPLINTVGFDSAGFDQAIHSIPEGLTLDPVTGWLSGSVSSQVEEVKTYSFQVYCYKVDYPTYISNTVEFTLTVLGDINNSITWTAPSDLGVLENGSVSELSISAVAAKNQLLRYDIKSGSASRLPQGLKLLPDGLIVGRSTFEHFTMDDHSTTFDKSKTTYDQKYSFTVVAHDVSNTVSAEKVFSITVNPINEKPYENLYLKALPSRQHRSTFNSIINNSELFPNELIYRSSDSNFGKAKDIRFLLAAGLEPTLIPEYIKSIHHNHYRKRIDFGSVKTAVALDEQFNVKYELVYVEVVDPATVNAATPPKQTNIQYSNPRRTVSVYPNTLANMKDEVSSVGYAYRGAIPSWMVNQQENGAVLGFVNAVVLAYTVPGASKLIAYRLKQSAASLNDIDFSLDRYHLDNTLSTYYNIPSSKFMESKESTFDRLPSVTNLNTFAAAVDVAVTIPFDEINARTVEYITRHGGVDGILIKSGMRLVFAKQEGFTTETNALQLARDIFGSSNFDTRPFDLSTVYADYTSPNDGWNNNITRFGYAFDANSKSVTGEITGETYSMSTDVPGYLDWLFSNVQSSLGIIEIQIKQPLGPDSATKLGDIVKYNNMDYKVLDIFPATLARLQSIQPGMNIVIEGVIKSSTNVGDTVSYNGADYRVVELLVSDNVAPLVRLEPTQLSYTGSSAARVENQRAGVWAVTITPDNVVLLEFVQQVELGQYVQVASGRSFGMTLLTYDPTVKPGHSVPEYSVLADEVIPSNNATRFDGGSTRFYNNRDQFNTFGENEKYITFPKFGMES